ncbi:tripartite tricarboxylate transporter substrate binding protein [Rhizobium rhizogenes]|uniref:Tripartite tricarboxylate transporter substrate binding protein n=1 Tax=Rhizobium rhizogenes TaxID=359 RepID=A0AA92C1B9_RHIRH|nr:tripartite tricarboxylate transporter substrate binding protein [Rhizobium rhizogenes]PVE52257.1 tripartite tricarboxylate transporter substrate binding protein [Rhizobium rhizogenes]PVE62066.1 tripartite tricarboxylate transporter substrate binding protein [Agrobacterium tumefaciens]PVE69848.1 tripartite tricarboxylate transporter substrate binding protein [Sphingomonas sp. TPD3009]
MLRRNLIRTAVATLVFAAMPAAAMAQDTGPITLLVGYSAGGSADFAARVIAPELTKSLGRSVVVENATGASGMIALQKLINGKADGSTLYYGGFDTVAVPMVNKAVGIDWKETTVPVGRTALTSMAIAVPAASPYKSLGELATAAKATPDTVTFGTPGIGSAQHFVGEMIGHRIGAKLLHAPYRGGTQVSNDLLAGILDSAVLTTSTALPFVKDGKIRILAVTSAERTAALPDVPALTEVEGLNGLVLPLWQGLFVKAGTDQAAAKTISDAIVAALARDEVKERLASAGFAAAPMPVGEFTGFIEQQADTYRKIVQESSISVE